MCPNLAFSRGSVGHSPSGHQTNGISLRVRSQYAAYPGSSRRRSTSSARMRRRYAVPSSAPTAAITGTLRDVSANPVHTSSDPAYPGWRTSWYGPEFDHRLIGLGAKRPCVRIAERAHRPGAKTEPCCLDGDARRPRAARQPRRRSAPEHRRQQRRCGVGAEDHARGAAILVRRLEARRATALARRRFQGEEPGHTCVAREKPRGPPPGVPATDASTHGESVTPGWYAPRHD